MPPTKGTDTKPAKNSLAIRLSESVLFLRTPGRRPGEGHQDAPTSMLRGLLTLELVKPTRISSISIELEGKSSASWPEGVGARRIEIIEQHKVFQASTVFFDAKNDNSSRRTASIGPGIHHDEETGDESDFEDNSVTPRNGLLAMGSYARRDDSPDGLPTISRPQVRHIRRVSLDGTHFSRDFVSDHQHPPTPPYTPSPVMTAHNSLHEDNPGQTLEDMRNILRAELGITSVTDTRRPSSRLSLDGAPPKPRSALTSTRSSSSVPHITSPTLSRQPSITGVPEDVAPLDHTVVETPLLSPSLSSSRSASVQPSAQASSSSTPNREQSVEGRGRKKARFSFAAVSNAILGAVKGDKVERSHSPPSRGRGASFSRGQGEGSVDRGGRSSSPRGRAPEKKEKSLILGRLSLGDLLKTDEGKTTGDGWVEFKKGTYTYPISFAIPGNSPPSLQTSYGNFVWRLKGQVHRPGAFKTKLTAQREVVVISSPVDTDDDHESTLIQRHWEGQLQYVVGLSGKAFYIGGTMSIHFTMMPLTKMKVHRVAVYLEERVDYYVQMKRLARTDPIRRFELLSLKSPNKEGGPILPLDPDHEHSFDTSPFYALCPPDASEYDKSEMALSFMGAGPWEFQTELHLPNSCGLLHFSNKNRKSNISVTHTLKTVLRVERGDDQEVDAKTGKRKLFDIVVATPITILACRCNPEWTALPQYSEDPDDKWGKPMNCPCKDRCQPSSRGSPFTPARGLDALDHNPAVLATFSRTPSYQPGTPPQRNGAGLSRTSSMSTAEINILDNATRPSERTLSTLLDRNSQFERLISGQESELGEAPPSYTASQQLRSRSRGRMTVQVARSGEPLL